MQVYIFIYICTTNLLYNIFMSTYREVIYMVNDQLKFFSDDASYTEDHIKFIINNLRSWILEKKYKNETKIPLSNYQTICLELEETPAIAGTDCFGSYLKSKVKIPTLCQFGGTTIYPIDFISSRMISLVSLDRIKYAGEGNKYLGNMIYAAIGPDNYLYLKSNNPQFLNLEKIKLMGIFIDNEKASELECDNNGDYIICDILDREFPLDNSLVELLVNYAVTELSGQRYVPTDKTNNASDDMSGMMSPNTRYKQPTVNYE